jgi:NIPSNAP protein
MGVAYLRGGLEENPMIRKYALRASVLLATFVVGVIVGNGPLVRAENKNRVFEIRTYTAHPGRLSALVQRMGHGENKAFTKAGMPPVGFFVATESPKSQDTFVYILAHESREAAKASWDKFRDDPDWKVLRAASEADGAIVAKAETIFVTPTDFSPLK